MAAMSSAYELAFQVKDRERVYSRFVVANTELSMSILAPAPSQSLIINGYTHVPSHTDMHNWIWNSEDLGGNRVFAIDAAAPQVQLTLFSHTCWAICSFDLDHSAVLDCIYLNGSLSLLKALTEAKL